MKKHRKSTAGFPQTKHPTQEIIQCMLCGLHNPLLRHIGSQWFHICEDGRWGLIETIGYDWEKK